MGFLWFKKKENVTFKQLVESVLEKQGFEFGGLDLSGDYGADFVISQFGKKMVVRCISLTKDSSLNADIDKISSAKLHYNANEAWLIISGSFTAAERLYGRGILLTDGDEFKSIQEKVMKDAKKKY